MSQYKVTFHLTEKELEILHDAVYCYSNTSLDSDTGAYVSEDVERFYEKINSLYLEEDRQDPALDAFIAQYGINARIENPEKWFQFREAYYMNGDEYAHNLD